MLSELNEYQKSQLDVYRDKWLAIGYSTEPTNIEASKKAIAAAYAEASLPVPTRFEIADSPMHAIALIKEIDPTKTSTEILNSMIYGAHDADWLSYYDYFKEVCDIKECERLSGLIELAKNCGWLNVYDDMVVFQHRPTSILMDDQNRLHCDHAAAITYRDGFSVYSWHGVRIPAEWIENKASLTPEAALTWPNVEQRRAACEILGWASILSSLNSVTIDEDADPMIGTLVEVEIPEIGSERFLRVLCGTGREFALPVPPEMETALQANAWTFGLDTVDDFVIPEIRT